MVKHILIADDDPHICEVITFALQQANMRVTQANDGQQALQKFTQSQPDLIILDIGMPELDGIEVCKNIRKTSDIPILFLSSRDDEIDRIIGLEIGADDYVTKPFSPRELVARVNAILKRTQAKPTKNDDRLNHGNLSIWPEQARIEYNNSPVELTSKEFAILNALILHPQKLFSRDDILTHAYQDNINVSDRTIDSHIRHIRSKFVALGCNDIIITMHGMGYKLGLCR